MSSLLDSRQLRVKVLRLAKEDSRMSICWMLILPRSTFSVWPDWHPAKGDDNPLRLSACQGIY